MGRATYPAVLTDEVFEISIHALRGEGDSTVDQKCVAVIYISIHALRGEGDDISIQSDVGELPFQSTPSVGRATAGA